MSQGNQDSNFFVLEDIGTLIAELEAQNLPKEEEFAKKEELFRDYAVKSERIHTLSQLLKAYTLFEKDDEYVVMDGEVKNCRRTDWAYYGRKTLLRRTSPSD